MRTVRVGIIGAKFAAMLHTESYRRLEHVQVVAVADTNKETLDGFAERYDIPNRYCDAQELLARDDVDLVSICVPNFLHAEWVIAAARAGKPVICEKPLATTLADGLAMIEGCARAGVRLMYAEDWCCAPSLRRAKEIVDQGGIGKLLYVKAKETHNGSHSIYAQNKEYAGGGALLHLGIHPVGWVRWLVGQEVAEVVGRTSDGGTGNLLHENYTVEDWGAALLRFADGTRALVEANYLTFGGMDDVVEIYGSEGVVKVDLTFGGPLRVYSRPGYDYAVEKADTTTGWTRPAVDEFASLGYCDEIATFVDCVRLGRPVPAGLTGEDGLKALAIVLGAYQSSQTGRPVDPRELLAAAQ